MICCIYARYSASGVPLSGIYRYSDYTYMICCICSSSSSSGSSSRSSSRFEGGVYPRCRLQNKRGSCSDSAYQCEGLTPIHVFLWRNHKDMNSVFRLVHPVYAMNTYIFKVNVFTKQAKYE